jgi:putative ABC transport system permease protein
MFRNFLLITVRSMLKNKLFIFINLVGMSIAIGCCIVGYFAYRHDAGFDLMHENSATVYRISSNRVFNNEVRKFGTAPLPLGKVVEENIKDVDKMTRYHFSWSDFKRGDDLFESRLAYVDPTFFGMFTFEFIAGGPSEMKDKTSVAINESMAIRLFGSATEAYGKTITQVYGKDLKEVKITGVFQDQPQNSSVYRQEAYMNFENLKDEFKDSQDTDWRRDATVFVQIEDPDRVPVVAKQLQTYVENNNKVREDFQIKEYSLDQLATMAHNDRDVQVNKMTWAAPPFSAIIGSSIMGIMILLIACFNLTNTAIAISSRRLKEIGIRKVMGSVRSQLIYQFIGETTFLCMLSLVLGIFVSQLLLEGWNGMWEFMQLKPHYDSEFFIFAIGILLFAGIVAGAYPALYISKFEPISILKGKTKFGGTSLLTRFLLGGQFAISLIAIVSSIAFYQNAVYQENYDLGFNVRSAVISWLSTSDEVQAYKNALAGNPKIASFAGAKSGIFSNHDHEPVELEGREVEVDIIDVGDGYLQTMNITLVAGRDFIQDSESDKRESIIISQRMADEFGLDKPLGKEFIYRDSVHLFVVGVVKDVYTMGLWRELQPLMIRYIAPESYSQLVISATPGNVKEVDEYMEAKWKGLFPYRVYNGRKFMSMGFEEVLNVNKNILVMFAFLGVIAMLLSATGLFTLVSLNIIRRMKEIGVRKVLGASVSNITRIINTEFFVILIIASIIGCGLSYVSVNSLMGSIWKYYQASNAVTFIVAVVIMFVISIGVVGYKIFSAASMNPVNTLKEE